MSGKDNSKLLGEISNKFDELQSRVTEMEDLILEVRTVAIEAPILSVDRCKDEYVDKLNEAMMSINEMIINYAENKPLLAPRG